MAEDGVIKFNCEWEDNNLPVSVPSILLKWRDKMFEHRLIGEYKDIKIGYGNISLKLEEGILISGTQTGNIYPIQAENFSLVVDYDMSKNWVKCVGKVKASAESLTHAAFYEADEFIHAIIHVHNIKLWNKLIDKIPTSKREVPYGTAEMASEIKRLFLETNIKEKKLMVMGGHKEGLIAFGENLDEAGKVLFNVLT